MLTVASTCTVTTQVGIEAADLQILCPVGRGL